jgi:hypothetical protein
VTTLASVARRGSSAGPRRIAAAIDDAAGPLTRTTPIPPRPGGVAIATIVSLGENTDQFSVFSSQFTVFSGFSGSKQTQNREH